MNRALIAKAEPVCLWHQRQWQQCTISGSDVSWYRTWPHVHPPSSGLGIDVIVNFYSCQSLQYSILTAADTLPYRVLYIVRGVYGYFEFPDIPGEPFKNGDHWYNEVMGSE